jgi:hypothetical protein
VRYLPTSATVDTYVGLFAPLIAEQPAGSTVNPLAMGWLHRNQKIVTVGDGVPVQVPVSSVHVDPTFAEPDTVGAVLSNGNPTATVLTAPASENPYVFVPPIWAVRYVPVSADVDT